VGDELDRPSDKVASPSSAGEAPAPLGSDPAGCRPEHVLRAGAGGLGEPAEPARPDRTTRYLDTARGVLSYSQVAPLLAEQVVRLEARIYAGEFSDRAIDENLVADFHRAICFELVPEWAGRWRSVEIRVGNLHPPLPSQVPLRMRDYGRDLVARWQHASEVTGDLTLEFLAFAEGRFLSIHPFQDFNGRTIRLFLLEILQRLDLPRVVLAPEHAQARDEYFRALEAADLSDWRPLMGIWSDRFLRADV
jgi:CRISPR-associated endonuclease/helicase Cas3